VIVLLDVVCIKYRLNCVKSDICRLNCDSVYIQNVIVFSMMNKKESISISSNHTKKLKETSEMFNAVFITIEKLKETSKPFHTSFLTIEKLKGGLIK